MTDTHVADILTEPLDYYLVGWLVSTTGDSHFWE